MRSSTGRLTDISLDPADRQTAWIECPSGAVPDPGRYCLLAAPDDREAVLPVIAFPGEIAQSGFLAVGTLPRYWLPGVSLLIRGPLGKGFNLPSSLNRLALVAVGETPSRLMPVAQMTASRGADVAWFSDMALPGMPPAYELNPLEALVGALDWADFVVIDIPFDALSSLKGILGLQGEESETLPSGQVLVHTSMPCGGVGECGACAVSYQRGWKLACLDGPVFDLAGLLV